MVFTFFKIRTPFDVLFQAACKVFRPLWADLPLGGHQGPAQQVQVGQANQQVDLRGVLRQTPVADLAEAELAFDDAENMFNPRPHRGLFAVALFLFGRQVLFRFALVVDTPAHPQVAGTALVFVAGVAGVAEHHFVVPAQQVGQFGDVGGVGRGHGDAVYRAGVDVGADVDFHPKIPLVTFLGGVHVRIAGFVLVLGGAGGMDEGGIHHRAFGHQQAVCLEVGVDGVQQHGGEAVVFEEMPEVEDRGLVRQSAGDTGKARKTAHALDFVERVLHLAVGEAEPLLHAMDAQHRGQGHGLAATAA